MGLESGTFIDDLVVTNPVGATDPKSQGDDHLRLLKAVLKGSFPGTTAARYIEQAFENVVCAATIDLGAVVSDHVNITGATGPVTSFGTAPAGTRRICKTASTPTITHHATSLICPGGANIVCAAGDLFCAVSLGSGNWVIAWFTRASGKALAETADLVSSVFTRTGAVVAAAGDYTMSQLYAAIVEPQGRLTLVSGSPVMSTSQASASTVYYSPYKGNLVPIFDGTRFVLKEFNELSQTTSDTTKSPAAVAANKNYDIFVWDDSGTLRATRGPAWTNDTTRASALVRQNGVLLNQASITNGPAASRGTYVGTVRSNGSSQIEFLLGGTGVGGSPISIGVWNMYNRRWVAASCHDSTDSWDYTTFTWRSANGSDSMRASFVQGLAEDGVDAEYIVAVVSNIGSGHRSMANGIGLDSTSTPSGSRGFVSTQSPRNITCVAKAASIVALGFHFLQALEISEAANTTTWYGDNGGNYTQNGLSFKGMF